MTNNKIKIFQAIFFAVALAAVLYPVAVWFDQANLTGQPVTLFKIFPVFGLIAFTVMWLHIVGAPFRTWLEKYFDFQRFVAGTSAFVFICLILHPLLLLIALGPAGRSTFKADFLIWIAAVAWIIFIGYDLAKKFQEHAFLARHWQTIKLISTLAFFPVFIHSLGLGHNLQAGPLRLVWIFYGLTAAVATVYSYGPRALGA